MDPPELVYLQSLRLDQHGHLPESYKPAVLSLLVAAFEGGITHWCRTATAIPDSPRKKGQALSEHFGDTLAEGGCIELEVDADKAYLTLPALLYGIQLRAAWSGTTISDWLAGHDAGEADAAVQLAVFGSVRYG
jgi:hypothetical protein